MIESILVLGLFAVGIALAAWLAFAKNRRDAMRRHGPLINPSDGNPGMTSGDAAGDHAHHSFAGHGDGGHGGSVDGGGDGGGGH